MRWSNSIAFKFSLAMNLLVLIGTLCLSGAYFWKETQHLESALRDQGLTAANTVNSAIGISMLKQEYEKISPLAYSLIDQPNIQYVIIRDNDGQIVNQKGETITTSKLLIEEVPLTLYNTNLGEIEIALKTDSFVQQRNRLMIFAIIGGVLFSIISVVLSTLISKKLTAPLKKLLQATKLMSDGNRNISVVEEGAEEIRQLSKSFNLMSKTIDHQEAHLESEIHKATQNLSNKIRTLQIMEEMTKTFIEEELDRSEIIEVILDKIKEYLNPDVLSVAICDDTENKNISIYFKNDDGTLSVVPVQSIDSPVHKVIVTKQPLIRNLNTLESIHYKREKMLLESGILSTMLLPLIAKNKIYGSINIGSKKVNAYTEKDIQELSVFSHQIAIALDRAYAYKSLQDSAYHDYLTGLPNHRSFRDLLEQEIEKANGDPSKLLAVMYLDFDRFKMVNDTLGHKFGDLLLKTIGQKLQKHLLNKNCAVSRIGGDEFTVLLSNIHTEEEIIQCAKQITQLFNEPILLEGYELHITASLGIAVFPFDGEDVDTLINHADTAMYRVKDEGKNNYLIYTPSKNDPLYNELLLENDLRKAIDRNELTVFYQPKIDIQSGNIAGLEALVRWNHPTKGLVSPGKFIPLAEETGLIIPIGEYVIKSACKQINHLEESGFGQIPISINLSTRQFLQSNLVDTIAAIIHEIQIDPKLLEFEITETMTMDVNRTIAILNELKNLGISISVDDFGTGYSSLNYICRLPIDRIKIDRSFITNISSNHSNAQLVTTIITMAKNLNLKVVAEGVETKVEAQFLQKQGCNEIQGYFFSKPLSPEDLALKFENIQNDASKWKSQYSIK